jgi:hypothetical protein
MGTLQPNSMWHQVLSFGTLNEARSLDGTSFVALLLISGQMNKRHALGMKSVKKINPALTTSNCSLLIPLVAD